MSIEPAFGEWLERIESGLDATLRCPADGVWRLHDAMRHAVLGGGKRLRPLLVHASGRLLGARPEALDAPAVAVELIHAYSLVHDDLPAMDDDALRRGQPTVHIAFDEATAILAGDALQALAFEVLAKASVDSGIRVELMATLARASGAAGMCGGQALDLAATGTHQSLAALEGMHALKTGALIRAAVRMGALCGNASELDLDTLDHYASALGLAFQIRDDILDVEASSAELGKTAGKDAAQDKPTFASVLGLEASKQRLAALATDMDACLSGFGDAADALRALGRLAIERRH